MNPLTEENFVDNAFIFRDRQAGVSPIYDPDTELYSYNAYCLETKLMKEIYSKEFQFLSEALDFINEEFGNWSLDNLSTKNGCSTCSAKG